jgi:hypothetical protein
MLPFRLSTICLYLQDDASETHVSIGKAAAGASPASNIRGGIRAGLRLWLRLRLRLRLRRLRLCGC